MRNGIVFLDRNENQYGPAPLCFKVLRNISNDALNSYSRDFTRGVKSILTERLAKDTGVAEKNIILGYGSEDILKQAVQCYLGSGSKILIPSKSWWYYKKIAEESGGANVEYPVVENGNEFSCDIVKLLEIYHEHKPGILLISSPNNPTGNRMEIEQLNFILENTRDGVVVLDEAYSQFDPDYKVNPAEFIEKFPHLIIIRTFSKYYGLAGLRIGYAFVGSKHENLKLLGARYLGFNRLSEKVAIAALDSPEYYRRTQKLMVDDREMFFREFNKLPGFTAYRSYANFILIKIPAEIKEELNQYLTERNIIIKFMNENGLNSHIRITIGTRAQNLKLIKAVKSFIEETSRS